MTNEERKQMILQITEQLQDLSLTLGRLIASCPHDIKQIQSKAACFICTRVFGWWCEESPDHVCHYKTLVHPVTQTRGILLADGNFYPLDIKEDYDSSTETEESCLFCEKPLIRKNDEEKIEGSSNSDPR